MENEIRYTEKDKEFFQVSKKDNWIPCLICKGELNQLRKAFFKCINCGQEYIADEDDMIPPAEVFSLKEEGEE